MHYAACFLTLGLHKYISVNAKILDAGTHLRYLANQVNILCNLKAKRKVVYKLLDLAIEVWLQPYSTTGVQVRSSLHPICTLHHIGHKWNADCVDLIE